MGEIESVGQAYEDMQVRSGDLHGQLALQTGLLGCRKVVVVSCCCCRCRSCRCCRQGTATLGFGCACAIMLIAFCHRAAHLLLQAQNQRLLTSLAQRDEDASKMLQQVRTELCTPISEEGLYCRVHRVTTTKPAAGTGAVARLLTCHPCCHPLACAGHGGGAGAAAAG